MSTISRMSNLSTFTYHSKLVDANREHPPVKIEYIDIVPSVLPAFVKEITPDVQLKFLQCEEPNSDFRDYLLTVFKSVIPHINKAITLLKGPIPQDVKDLPSTQEFITRLIYVYTLLIKYNPEPIRGTKTWIDTNRPLIDYANFLDCIMPTNIDAIIDHTEVIHDLTVKFEQNVRKAGGPPVIFSLVNSPRSQSLPQSRQAAGRRRRTLYRRKRRLTRKR